MENTYHISEDQPNLLVDKIGMIADRYSPRGMNGSLPLDLDNLDGKRRIEYRFQKRFKLNNDAFALIRSINAAPLKISGKSMGCIACAVYRAKPAKLGKIDNISMGGLMFHHVEGNTQLSQETVLDILLVDCGFYLANIRFKTMSELVIPDNVFNDEIEMRQVRLQFQKMTNIQLTRLQHFILTHGTEEEFGITDDE
jgi:hypothetical protein